jgi:hypothetical protein
MSPQLKQSENRWQRPEEKEKELSEEEKKSAVCFFLQYMLGSIAVLEVYSIISIFSLNT